MEENIYQELKSDFKKNESGKKSNYLVYFWAVVVIVCIYLFTTHTGNARAREVSKSMDFSTFWIFNSGSPIPI